MISTITGNMSHLSNRICMLWWSKISLFWNIACIWRSNYKNSLDLSQFRFSFILIFILLFFKKDQDHSFFLFFGGKYFVLLFFFKSSKCEECPPGWVCRSGLAQPCSMVDLHRFQLIEVVNSSDTITPFLFSTKHFIFKYFLNIFFKKANFGLLTSLVYRYNFFFSNIKEQ